MFVQAKAGHAQGSTTERYLHASQTSYPEAPRNLRRLGCSAMGRKLVEVAVRRDLGNTKSPVSGAFQ